MENEHKGDDEATWHWHMLSRCMVPSVASRSHNRHRKSNDTAIPALMQPVTTENEHRCSDNSNRWCGNSVTFLSICLSTSLPAHLIPNALLQNTAPTRATAPGPARAPSPATKSKSTDPSTPKSNLFTNTDAPEHRLSQANLNLRLNSIDLPTP